MNQEESVYELNRIQRYIMQMRPLLKKNALFSDGTADYRQPVEPDAGDEVTVRFRTARDNVDIVWLCTGDKKYKMKKTETGGAFDYYEVKFTLGEEPFYYYFKVASGLLNVYYDRYGVSKEKRDEYRFCIIPGFSTPEWSKGAVMYQILVDRFYNGDTSNDVLTDEYYYIRSTSRKMDSWDQCPSDFSVAEFYGGDLEGVRQKLDYLQNLGVEVIYFNPLFVSPSNHKYDIQDYDYIDPHYGKIVEDGGGLLKDGVSDNRKAERYINRVTNKKNLEASNRFFAELVEEIHARGMKVILDGVFNHCGSFNKWLDREEIYQVSGDYEDGAFVSKDSPYRNFFGFQDQFAWPYNTTYEGWWGHDTLPKLNYEGSEKLYDDIMRVVHGDDYGIACCVSSMRIGKEMQFFGARANLAKCLLYAINGGVDEMTGKQVGPKYRPITSEYLDYDEVWDKYKDMMKWLAGVYVNALNIIHYMHDKYCYEKLEMALHDKNVRRWFATGIAGFSVVADSLSAIKYAKVKPIRDENGVTVDFEIEGDFPKYGNDDDRVDEIAKQVLHTFIGYVKGNHTYRGGIQTTSILTITSNVSYGKNTGATPDGRKKGVAFAPGANPMHGRDKNGAVASLASVAKMPFMDAQDGISNTFTIVPDALGKTEESSETNLVALLDGYAEKGGHHLNVNVLNKETLLDAQKHPEQYKHLVVRVAGYSALFTTLSKSLQDDIIRRTEQGF